jgi:hypothetical protein
MQVSAELSWTIIYSNNQRVWCTKLPLSNFKVLSGTGTWKSIHKHDYICIFVTHTSKHTDMVN